ncbi:MAG: A/G-specific adenine glycosylase [Saprospiraceae bacterium]|nr:A/G-specific adenine glycosylase [Saprospiraceae bacterium]
MNHPIANHLIHWHEAHPRALVWKQYSDAYSIWLSEIIMQQTRVEQGSAYFEAFKNAFPTVFDLAKAPLDEVIRLWEGLGYYSRARNLHLTAQVLVKDYQGVFPKTPNEIQQLKGIGPYTAAAIASFAFNYPIAAIDGNAYRVLSRLFDIDTPIDSSSGRKQFQELGNSLLDPAKSGTFNQALMNFGALVCTPKKPKCNDCVLQQQCLSFSNQTTDSRPVKSKSLKKTPRYFNYFFLQQGKDTWIGERKSADIWQNLYEFPLIETSRPLDLDSLVEQAQAKNFLPAEFTIKKLHTDLKQILSHRIIYTKIVEIEVPKAFSLPHFQKTAIQAIGSQPFPRILKKFLTQQGISANSNQ